MKKLMALVLSLIFVFSMTVVAEDDSLKRITDSGKLDRKSTRLNSSHSGESRMPSSA